MASDGVLATELARGFLPALLVQPAVKTLPSAEYFLVDGKMLGADKGYDAEAFVEELKGRKIVPHVAINGTTSKTGRARKTAVPPHVAQSPGYTNPH